MLYSQKRIYMLSFKQWKHGLFPGQAAFEMENKTGNIKKERVWELDALRGICIIGVIIVHFVFDLTYFLGVDLNTPAVFDFIQQNGGVLFIVISGICVTLGHHFFKRGIVVLFCGFAVTWVTYVMYLTKVSGKDIIIYWGILHLLGACMILYGLIKKLPTAVIPFIAAALIIPGYILAGKTFDLKGFSSILTIFGFVPKGFVSGDYFPLMPNLGWFMIGIFIGRTAYKRKKSLLPSFPYRSVPVRILSFLGRHSLWIYLLHQPVISGVIAIIGAVKK